jgi:hypothetical protein
MLLKPNDLPPMILGESRKIEFRLSGAVGANTINSFSIEAVPAQLSFGTPSISGSNVTVLVNADTLGSYELVPTAVLSSAETVKGLVRVKVIEARNLGSICDYRTN